MNDIGEFAKPNALIFNFDSSAKTPEFYSLTKTAFTGKVINPKRGGDIFERNPV